MNCTERVVTRWQTTNKTSQLFDVFKLHKVCLVFFDSQIFLWAKQSKKLTELSLVLVNCLGDKASIGGIKKGDVVIFIMCGLEPHQKQDLQFVNGKLRSKGVATALFENVVVNREKLKFLTHKSQTKKFMKWSTELIGDDLVNEFYFSLLLISSLSLREDIAFGKHCILCSPTIHIEKVISDFVVGE